MENITISNLFTYPIKSSKEISLESVKILETGFEFDRHFALINVANNIITARENPKLLQIKSTIHNGRLTLTNSEQESLEIDLQENKHAPFKVTLFFKKTFGKLVNSKTDQWFSNALQEPCKLIRIDNKKLRAIENSNLNTKIAFTDAYPIHIITTASINELNSKLETPINDNRYRPNIIISGTKAFEEESWKKVIIGNCEFEVILPTERCSLITINPTTLEKNKQQEPLRTLAKNKRGAKKVNFGIYLVPKNTGTIKKTDLIKIIR